MNKGQFHTSRSHVLCCCRQERSEKSVLRGDAKRNFRTESLAGPPAPRRVVSGQPRAAISSTTSGRNSYMHTWSIRVPLRPCVCWCRRTANRRVCDLAPTVDSRRISTHVARTQITQRLNDYFELTQPPTPFHPTDWRLSLLSWPHLG